MLEATKQSPQRDIYLAQSEVLTYAHPLTAGKWNKVLLSHFDSFEIAAYPATGAEGRRIRKYMVVPMHHVI